MTDLNHSTTLDEYQDAALATWRPGRNDFQQQHPLAYLALGVAGEAGELVDKIKKGLRNGNLDKAGTVREIGDVLWYLAVLASELGETLSAVAEANIEKLADRQARGVIKSEGDNR